MEIYTEYIRMYTHTRTHTRIVNKFTWTTQEANQEQTPNWADFAQYQQHLTFSQY